MGQVLKTILFGPTFAEVIFFLISRLPAPPLLPLLPPLLLHLRPLALPTLPGTGCIRAGKTIFTGMVGSINHTLWKGTFSAFLYQLLIWALLLVLLYRFGVNLAAGDKNIYVAKAFVFTTIL